MSNEVALHTGLGLTPHQVSQLGAFGVARESLKLCYRSPLLSIQFAIVLPSATLIFLFQLFQQLIILPKVSLLLTLYLVKLKTPSTAVDGAPHMNWWLGLLWFALMIFTFLISLCVRAAIFVSVGSIYSSKRMTLTQVLKVVPRFLRRLLVVNVYCLVLVVAVGLVFITVLSLWFKFLSDNPAFSLVMLLGLTLLTLIALCIITILSLVALCVTYYEESDGWTAYTRGTKALKGNWVSGILLLVICDTPLSILSFGIGRPIWNANSFRWTYLVLGVVYILLSSWIYQFMKVAWPVFYFSCTEKHKKQLMTHDIEVGYQRIATDQSVL